MPLAAPFPLRGPSAMLAGALVLSTALAAVPRAGTTACRPGARVLLDAHNAYPDQGAWADRIERGLATGVPVAIEQDLVWHCLAGGTCDSVVSHGPPTTGTEPSLRAHFFERIRPVVERALEAGDRTRWPLITLNLDFKTNEPEHHAAVWDLLGAYETWLTTAPRSARADDIAALRVGPVLVLTGDSVAQEAAFHDRVGVGTPLRLFGAVAVAGTGETVGSSPDADALAPQTAEPGRKSNYRRWWNNPWAVVEGGGPSRAGAWTTRDNARLTALVSRAHGDGLWIRFYTLNGHAPDESRGWSAGYNFGSREAAAVRWRAAVRAGVDFVATDQYEAFAAVLARSRSVRAGRGRVRAASIAR